MKQPATEQKANHVALVRSRAKRAHDALRDRDEAIRAAAEAGESLRTIAAAAGLTHPGVAKIVRRDIPA